MYKKNEIRKNVKENRSFSHNIVNNYKRSYEPKKMIYLKVFNDANGPS